MSYWKDKKILVTGGSGFLGQHTVLALRKQKPKDLISVGSKDYDLTREDQVQKLFKETSPDIVFNLAGLVGGIQANKDRPGDFFYHNLMIGTLVMHYAFKNKVSKVIAVGAGCGYPEFGAMPLKETGLWEGFPQPDSAPYSLAKRMLTIQSAAYNKQFGFQSIVCIPGNVYGEYDNFNLRDSHVIPALVRKFVDAKRGKQSKVDVWGSGTPTRDYVYAGDVADGMIRAAEKYSSSEIINISSGEETSVREICDLLTKIVGFEGSINWQSDRPEGQKRRWFDVSKTSKDLNFKTSTTLAVGLKKTVDWYLENIDSPALRK